MLLGREVLNGITECSPRNGWIVLSEECEESAARYLARFTQRPSDSFLNQIVLVGKQLSGNAEGIFDLAILDQCKRRYDGDAPFPNDSAK